MTYLGIRLGDIQFRIALSGLDAVHFGPYQNVINPSGQHTMGCVGQAYPLEHKISYDPQLGWNYSFKPDVKSNPLIKPPKIRPRKLKKVEKWIYGQPKKRPVVVLSNFVFGPGTLRESVDPHNPSLYASTLDEATTLKSGAIFGVGDLRVAVADHPSDLNRLEDIAFSLSSQEQTYIGSEVAPSEDDPSWPPHPELDKWEVTRIFEAQDRHGRRR